MGIFDAFEGWKYGQKLEIDDFRKMLAKRGLRLTDVPLPDLLNNMDLKNARNPYASPGTGERKIPYFEIYQYFRFKGKGDNVEYFVQHIADSKNKHGIWMPGPAIHTPIKLPDKKDKTKIKK